METAIVSSSTSLSPNAIPGVRWASLPAGIKASGKPDLALMEIAPGSSVAAVFTQNAFCAAPVTAAKSHMNSAAPLYCLVNAGNANAGTGEAGMAASLSNCSAVAAAADCDPAQVLPFSTGVIGELLPAEKINSVVPQLLEGLSDSGWQDAAMAIMTTDTRPKAVSRSIELAGKLVNITGICKGAGMIRPDMATMLAFVATDAGIEQEVLKKALAIAVSKSFNRITVDGDTSTNDACVLAATGKSGVSLADDTENFNTFCQQLSDLFVELATEIIRDAEGATKFVSIDVQGGSSEEECLAVAYTVAESPLVKTALFASDANWGRILAAVGRANQRCHSLDNLNVDEVSISIGEVLVCEGGGVAVSYTEAAGSAEMAKTDIVVSINLGRGEASSCVWTSDLSHDYVSINADYRS